MSNGSTGSGRRDSGLDRPKEKRDTAMGVSERTPGSSPRAAGKSTSPSQQKKAGAASASAPASASPTSPSAKRPSSSGRTRSRAPTVNSLHSLLEPFNRANGAIPETSRAAADVAEQKTANQIGLLESWKYLPFLAHQATSLASAFVSHHVFGPPKKSWGIELTLFTTAIRESVQYSHLSSLGMLRKFLNLQQVLPTPGDGVVTPVVFAVKRRGLPGLLQAADEREDGSRELTGEWVVSKRIWRRMQQEHYSTPAATPTGKSSGNSRSSSKAQPIPNRKQSQRSGVGETHHQFQPHSGKDKVVLYLHGGAYYVMSAATHRFITISVSKYTDCRVFAVNYRLAPECRWPGQIHDAVSGYFRLIHDLKIPPENIIFAGDSAGGGLTLATMMYLRDNGLPLPSGAIVMSPWVDLTMSCDSWETNAPYDYLRMPSGDDHMNPIASLLGAENVKRLITHPYVSPLFGDFTGFPPLLIQCGDAECLRDEGTLLAHKASLAGVQVYHEVYEDCPHVFQAFFFLEAAKKAFRSHRNFVKRVLPTIRRSTRVDLSSMDREVMSDAHAIKEDGEPEAKSLPASPGLSVGESATDTTMSGGSDSSMDEDDASHDMDSSIDAAGVPYANLQREGYAPDGTEASGVMSDLALRGVGGMISSAASLAAPSQQHHDLERVDEEQNESIAQMDAHNGGRYEGERDDGQSIRHSRYYTAASTAGLPSPSTSSTRPPPISTPSSPSYFRRQRSVSSLTLAPLTPSTGTRDLPLPSPGSTVSAAPSFRPSHSRTSSSSTITRPGIIRKNSRPRIRTNSHPDLQALLDSYEAAPSRNTVLFASREGSETSDAEDDMEIAQEGNRG